MTLKTRRILFILFIIAFITITPLLIAYATGYKFILGKKVLQKTGMLILDTKPRGAKIYLNNKPQQLFLKKYYKEEESFITTPAKIKNLLPGEYNVKLDLDGFWNWEKKLEIKPGMSTFAEDINLFKNNLPLLLINGEIIKSSISPNNKHLAVIKDKEIDIINLENNEEINSISKESISKSPELNHFSWSPNNDKILINLDLFNIENLSQKLDLNQFIKSKDLNMKWFDNNKISYVSSNESSIKNFDLVTKSNKILVTNEKIIDFLIKDDELYLINQTGNSINLVTYKTDSFQIIRDIELPSLSSYSFINPEHKLINLYDNKHQILYLIDPVSHSPLKEIINNIKFTYWVNENKLLYANDFEIWISNFSQNRVEQNILLTRISDEIKRILWHPSDNYVFYSTENTINTIELDDREKRNITEILKLNSISNLYLNKKGNMLYFYAKIGNQEGLYKLIIQ